MLYWWPSIKYLRFCGLFIFAIQLNLCGIVRAKPSQAESSQTKRMYKQKTNQKCQYRFILWLLTAVDWNRSISLSLYIYLNGIELCLNKNIQIKQCLLVHNNFWFVHSFVHSFVCAFRFWTYSFIYCFVKPLVSHRNAFKSN